MSHAVMPFPGCVVNSYVQAIERAEKLCGHPPNAGELAALLVHEDSRWTPLKKTPMLMGIIFNLYREDLVYTDKILGRFSVHK